MPGARAGIVPPSTKSEASEKFFKYEVIAVRLKHWDESPELYVAFREHAGGGRHCGDGSGKGAGAAHHLLFQLIRSSDSEQPPQAESKRVGTKLAGAFCGVLKWKK